MIRVTHIPVAENTIADDISRNHSSSSSCQVLADMPTLIPDYQTGPAQLVFSTRISIIDTENLQVQASRSLSHFVQLITLLTLYPLRNL